MNDTRHIQAYKQSEVGTASKMRLVIMMYDGVIRFLNECKIKIKEGDIAGRGLYISKAQKIINELQESVNRQKGGEVAENLERLYSFIMSNLTNANIQGDTSLIDQSIRVLKNLRDAWQKVMSSDENYKGKTAPKMQKFAMHL
ncbi:MAG: flagellar export chaperone FliS [Nitrospinota bacterium]